VTKPGQGVQRARLFEATVKWEPLSAGWTGGTCWDLAFSTDAAYAATQSGGVLRLALQPGATWTAADVNSGLPLRDRTRFQSIETVAVDPSGSPVLVGGASGVTRTTDGQHWTSAAGKEVADVVTIPDTWLLCSGEHDIEVVSESAATAH